MAHGYFLSGALSWRGSGAVVREGWAGEWARFRRVPTQGFRASTRGAPVEMLPVCGRPMGNPGPAPTPAGDKPLASRSLRPNYIFSFRPRTWVYNSAHQGLRCRSCGLVWRIGVGDSARPHPGPSRGQAPALHWLRGTHRRMRLVADFAMPHPGPSGDKPQHYIGCGDTQANEARGGFCQAPPRPQRGTSPSPREVFDRTTLAAGDTQANEARGGFCQAQPNPSRGQAPALHWLRGAHRRMRLVADFARPNPTPAGDKPLASRSLRPHYIFSFRPRTWVYNSAHQGLRCRSCGLVWRIGVGDSARPHPGPSWGQAPRLA